MAGLSLLAGPGFAQSSDGGAAPEATPLPAAEAHTAAAAEPNPEATAAANNSGFPKALSPQQRLPENLQGWLRERNRLRPAVAERPPTPPLNLAPRAEATPSEEQAAEGYKRRLRSFDEGGVTVLSNRHASAPAAPQPVAAAAAVAVAATVPAPRMEEDPEAEPPARRAGAARAPSTETHSLRAKQLKAKAPASDSELRWPTFAVPIAAIGLGLIWLRRRRRAAQ